MQMEKRCPQYLRRRGRKQRWILAECQSFLWEYFLKEKTEHKEMVYSMYKNCMIGRLQIKTILCLSQGCFLILQIRSMFGFCQNKSVCESTKMKSFILQFCQECLLKFAPMEHFPSNRYLYVVSCKLYFTSK